MAAVARRLIDSYNTQYEDFRSFCGELDSVNSIQI